MLRILAMLTLLIPLAAGCTFQPNDASQAVTVNPFALGSGQQVVGPANGPGYMNGEPMDMRR